jgi:NAD+ diphosphatase
VAEEVGVRIGTVRYVGSQPWPFPSSLMLGYVARALSTNIDVDGAEISDARWFTREQLRDQLARGEVGLPGRVSIARALIEQWYGGPLPAPPD